MRVCVDASTVLALGQIGELELLTVFDGHRIFPPKVFTEVTSEPARTNLRQLLDENNKKVKTDPTVHLSAIEEAKEILGESNQNGDIRLISQTLVFTENNDAPSITIVSDDKRVRTVANGLGATVTGTVGVIVRAVEERGITAEEGKDLVRRVDSHGLHMTGELREKAYELVEEAAKGE
jgi:predicted nucleic acid-binding protein